MATNSKLQRVLFHLEPQAWHGIDTERLWAEEVASGRYRLKNSPFYAKGISFQDVVFGKSLDDEAVEFAGVSMRGGHSTYRIFSNVSLNASEFAQAWAGLSKLGCSFEQGSEHLISVDVPPSANIYEVYDVLQKREADGIWEFEEGHCGHPLKS